MTWIKNAVANKKHKVQDEHLLIAYQIISDNWNYKVKVLPMSTSWACTSVVAWWLHNEYDTYSKLLLRISCRIFIYGLSEGSSFNEAFPAWSMFSHVFPDTYYSLRVQPFLLNKLNSVAIGDVPVL